ncbi:MAG: hypothetical protein MJE68_32840, partial [Proteobacteria bacterium]|nr:hypothetical protein [Pseudomonadota bacterium]
FNYGFHPNPDVEGLNACSGRVEGYNNDYNIISQKQLKQNRSSQRNSPDVCNISFWYENCLQPY